MCLNYYETYCTNLKYMKSHNITYNILICLIIVQNVWPSKDNKDCRIVTVMFMHYTYSAPSGYILVIILINLDGEIIIVMQSRTK